jgi:hypothetical protein
MLQVAFFKSQPLDVLASLTFEFADAVKILVRLFTFISRWSVR